MKVMNSLSLVLNKNWAVINAESVRDSISALFSEQRKIVHPYTFQSFSLSEWLNVNINEWLSYIPDHHKTPEFLDTFLINAGKQKLVCPEVVVCTEFNNMPTHSIKLTRKNVLLRDNMRCQYCGVKVVRTTTKKMKSIHEYTWDHVVPRGQGGLSTWDNLVTCCLSCNSKKAMRTPEQAGLTLLSKPHAPKMTLSLIRNLPNRRPSWDQFIETDKWDETKYWDVELQK